MCVFKGNDQMIKSNYSPITVLPTAAKVYELLMTEQRAAYSDFARSTIFNRFLQNC